MRKFKDFIIATINISTILYMAVVMIKLAATVENHSLFVDSIIEYDRAVLKATQSLVEANEIELAKQVIALGIVDGDICNTWVFNIFDWTETAYVSMPGGHILLRRLNYWREHGKLPPLSDPDLEYNIEVQSV